MIEFDQKHSKLPKNLPVSWRPWYLIPGLGKTEGHSLKVVKDAKNSIVFFKYLEKSFPSQWPAAY